MEAPAVVPLAGADRVSEYRSRIVRYGPMVAPAAMRHREDLPPRDGWWRCAFYPWSYPGGPPDGRPDSPLCPLCGPEFRWPWEPGLALATYRSEDVAAGERCFRCGEEKR